MRESTREAIETYHNGNISDFKAWLKKCRKIDILDGITYWTRHYNSKNRETEDFIYIMRNYLEG